MRLLRCLEYNFNEDVDIDEDMDVSGADILLLCMIFVNISINFNVIFGFSQPLICWEGAQLNKEKIIHCIILQLFAKQGVAFLSWMQQIELK